MLKKQSALFSTNEIPKEKRGNGTKHRVSRYSDLKRKLDLDPNNQNWQTIDTTKSKKCGNYNFIDLFAGAGGMSQGFKQAGFNKVFSVEIDPDASQTLRDNFPESTHFEGQIEDVTEEDISKATKGKKIHVVCGGPPCQGFSVAGLRNPQDPRNRLFREFVRVVEIVKPPFIVMENVPGILTMQGGKVYKEIIAQFEKAGYPNVSVRLLEAATFGVPQLRTRAVFIGSRFNVKNPYPKEIYKKEEYKTIKSAIDDLKNCEYNPAIGHWGTKHSKKMVERISKIEPGGSLYETYRDAYKRQYENAPSMTIKENHGGVHVHYELNRVLTVREMARLQTFPDDFNFYGSHKRGYWQIGNAVPVKMAENIAKAVGITMRNLEKNNVDIEANPTSYSKNPSKPEYHTKDNQHNPPQPLSLF